MSNMTPPPTIRRIAMLSVHTCPLALLGGKKTGGMNVYVREIAREFGRSGIAVDVFTRGHGTGAPHTAIDMGDRARVIHIQAGPPEVLDPAAVYPFLDTFLQNVLDFTRQEGLQYDIIYSHYWLSGWVAHGLRAEWNVPVVQMFHTLGVMKDRIANKPTSRPHDLRGFSEADIMSWADCLIAATPAEREQMLWLYRAPRRKIEIVPPGVDLDRFYPIPPPQARQLIGLQPHDRILLFVGRIEPLKGVDTIFEALALLKETEPSLLDHLHLCVIGGNPDDPAGDDAEMARLKSKRIELGLSEVVMFLGAKDQDTLNNYYAASEALIMPSDYESFGMVALEAMASGTPVIASAVGGLAFLVQDDVNGYHVPVREPAALAEKIRMILADPEQRLTLGRNAAEHAREYSWPRIASRLIAIFEKLPKPLPLNV